MNWRLFALGLILSVVSGIAGAGIHHWGFSSGHNDAVKGLKPIIDKAIDKETIKNEIKNEIQIDKIKKSDSITITLDPMNNQKPQNTILKNDCGDGFICMPVKNLTRKQKKRLRVF